MQHARLEHADAIEVATDVMRDDHVRRLLAQLVQRLHRRSCCLDREPRGTDELGKLAECFGLGVRDERSKLPLHNHDYIRGAFLRNGYIART